MHIVGAVLVAFVLWRAIGFGFSLCTDDLPRDTSDGEYTAIRWTGIALVSGSLLIVTLLVF